MESLLSLAFDNLSSYDGPKIRKGLKQIEGLLAPICLAASKQKSRSTRPTDPGKDSGASPPPLRRELADLPEDPAFCEFFRLQEGFQWNVVAQLVKTLDRLIAKSNDGQNDLLIVNALELTRGVLLLHPPSKVHFEREQNMNLLLDLLEPCNCPAIQSSTLLLLVAALVGCPRNTRIFEDLDGLLLVSSLFKDRATSREVKMKVVEFLYFYLMPESPSIPRAAARDSVPAMLQRSPSKLARAFGAAGNTGDDASGLAGRKSPGRGGVADEEDGMRSTEEKTALLGRHLRNVEDLVRDLRLNTPFGGVVA